MSSWVNISCGTEAHRTSWYGAYTIDTLEVEPQKSQIPGVGSGVLPILDFIPSIPNLFWVSTHNPS